MFFKNICICFIIILFCTTIDGAETHNILTTKMSTPYTIPQYLLAHEIAFTAIELDSINLFFSQLPTLHATGINKQYPDKKHATLLGYAVEKDHFAITLILIRHGANINAPSGIKKETPLQIAIAHNAKKVLNFLLNHPKLDINGTNYLGETALHDAVFFKQNDVLHALVQKNITLHHQDTTGTTALDIARGHSLYGHHGINAEAIHLLTKHNCTTHNQNH